MVLGFCCHMDLDCTILKEFLRHDIAHELWISILLYGVDSVPEDNYEKACLYLMEVKLAPAKAGLHSGWIQLQFIR